MNFRWRAVGWILVYHHWRHHVELFRGPTRWSASWVEWNFYFKQLHRNISRSQWHWWSRWRSGMEARSLFRHLPFSSHSASQGVGDQAKGGRIVRYKIWRWPLGSLHHGARESEELEATRTSLGCEFRTSHQNHPASAGAPHSVQSSCQTCAALQWATDMDWRGHI